MIETAGGTLDFYYQVTVTTGDLSTVALSDFLGASVSAGTNSGYSVYATANYGTVGPTTLQEVSNGTVNFGFLTAIASDTSLTLVVDTNATAYQAGGALLQDNVQISETAFAPGSVPEPTSSVLLGLVLVVGALLVRRRAARS